MKFLLTAFKMIRLGLLLCIFAKLTTSLKDRVVNIDQGPVRGYQPEGEDYFAFYGIPYATAPTGPNKFKVSYNKIFLLCHKNNLSASRCIPHTAG